MRLIDAEHFEERVCGYLKEVGENHGEIGRRSAETMQEFIRKMVETEPDAEVKEK